MDTTKVFSDLLNAYLNPLTRVIALKGGTRSSKTWSILQFLNILAERSKPERQPLISIVSETMPHLKRGAIRDFENMRKTEGVYEINAWHDTDKIYTFPNAKIEFFSADAWEKVLGPARDILYMNEAINMEWEVYRQLAVRTTGKIILDYNPAHEFWVDSKLAHREDVQIITSTYRDNDMLSAGQIAEIESNELIDPDWWKVYGLGEQGSKQGLVIKNWDQVDSMTQVFKKEWIGLDFGWTAPTAIMHIRLGERGEVWIDELAYLPNLDNPDIATIIKAAGLAHVETICDAAEPKSISELKALGIKAVKSDNKDIDLGISIMNRFKKHYTKRSVGSIAENRQYRYMQNKMGDYTNKPIDAHNHAKDSERYVFLNRLANLAPAFDVTVGTAR